MASEKAVELISALEEALNCDDEWQSEGLYLEAKDAIVAYIADLEAENEKLLQQQAHAEMEWNTAMNILDVDGECKDSAKDGDLIRLAQKVMGENASMREKLARFDPRAKLQNDDEDILVLTSDGKFYIAVSDGRPKSDDGEIQIIAYMLIPECEVGRE